MACHGQWFCALLLLRGLAKDALWVNNSLSTGLCRNAQYLSSHCMESWHASQGVSGHLQTQCSALVKLKPLLPQSLLESLHHLPSVSYCQGLQNFSADVGLRQPSPRPPEKPSCFFSANLSLWTPQRFILNANLSDNSLGDPRFISLFSAASCLPWLLCFQNQVFFFYFREGSIVGSRAMLMEPENMVFLETLLCVLT